MIGECTAMTAFQRRGAVMPSARSNGQSAQGAWYNGSGARVSTEGQRIYYKLSRWFRRRRNARLAGFIEALHTQTGRRVKVLDVGGLPSFWVTVGPAVDLCDILIINNEAGEYSAVAENSDHPENMALVVGDACDLEYTDDEFDLVVCNAVLEHVGDWKHVTAAAKELRRVGRHGWVEVPAFEFPIEVHYMRPVVHWLAEPLRAKVLRLTSRRVRAMSIAEIREMFDYVRLMTRREFESLFPEDAVTSELFLGMRKAHIVTW